MSKILSFIPICICINVQAAGIYMTEISCQSNHSFVEIYNSSNENISLNGWEFQCGKKVQKIKSDTIKSSSIKVIDLPNGFFTKDTLFFINNENDTIDYSATSSILKNKQKFSLVRDTVVTYNGHPLSMISPFKETRPSRCEIEKIYEEDRTIIYYSKDNESLELIGTYKTHEISFENTTFHKEDESKNDITDSIYVYPNPVTTILNIRNRTKKNKRYKLTTTYGQIINEGYLENEYSQTNMSSCDTGIYFLIIEEGEYIIKIKKENNKNGK